MIGRYGRTDGRGGGACGRAEWPKLTNPVCTLMQFKKTVQTDRAYKWLQVPPFKLMLNVGNDKIFYSIATTVSTSFNSFVIVLVSTV